MNPKSLAVISLTFINIACLTVVALGKATFSDVGIIIGTATGTIGGLITDADSVVNKIKQAIQKGKSDVSKTP